MMTRKKKILLIEIVTLVFAILIALFPLEDSPTIETKTAVTVAAFDRRDDKTQIYVQMTIPQQLAQGSSQLLVVEAEGKDVAEAFERLANKVGQEIELAHCGIIIIGEDMAMGGFTDDIDYMLSSGMISPQITLLNCDGAAKDFMQKLNQFSQTNGSGLFDVAAFSENSINVRIISALDFLSENHLPSNASSLPVISFEMQQGGGSSGGGESSGGGGGGDSSGGGSSGGGESSGGGGGGSETPTLKELDMSMLYKDGKAVGVMSPLGTKGISMFDRKSSKGYFEADNVVIGDKVISYVPMQVRKKQGKIKAQYRDGQPVITAEVNIKLETETRFNVSKQGIFASKEEVKQAIVKRVKEIVQAEIEESLKYSYETGADVLQIETAFYKQCYDKYKIYGTSDDFVKNVQVEYKINVDVT
ncbi:MAG: hypothetical protein J1F36_05585 [Clostridiales bacterium]|nr:hypothetical protein [Clostridiales bacterium]